MGSSLSRREFVWILSAAPLAACASSEKDGDTQSSNMPGTSVDGGLDAEASGNMGPEAASDAGPRDAGLPPVAPQPPFAFVHGVASGDPLQDRVILWTRVTPQTDDAGTSDAGTVADVGQLIVDFVVARDRELKDVVGRGRAQTTTERDYTIKVDVTGLSEGTTYYYQFFDPAAPTTRSPLGRTRTLATGSIERARIAFVSCSCYALGFFTSYAELAARKDLDAVLHLGDYIYEYGPEVYQDNAVGRPHDPPHEILTLSDYRTRYRQYRTDPDLAEAHRQHPFITVWDDHETANDTYSDGAENHTEGTEGKFTDRRAAALRAYHEWMPIRDLDPDDLTKIYRRFSFGDLFDLIMLETRTHRSKQDRGKASDPTRALMDAVQLSWLKDELSASQTRGTSWRVLGQQVMMGQLQLAGQILNADQWDGYQANRAQIFDHITNEGIDNVVVLTGDIHSSWAMDLAKDPFNKNNYDPATGKGALAVEFVGTSITSPGLEQLAGVGSPVVLSTHPHIKWIDLERHGYCVLDIDHTRVQNEWYVSASVKQTNAPHSFAKAFRVEAGVAHIVESKLPTDAIKERPELA